MAEIVISITNITIPALTSLIIPIFLLKFGSTKFAIFSITVLQHSLPILIVISLNKWIYKSDINKRLLNKVRCPEQS